MALEIPMVLVLGCTASGKSSLAFELARRWGGEILSIDSMKVYCRMDIGTAKPSQASQSEIKHHLIDVVEPWESFSLGKYVELADDAILSVQQRGKPLIAVGGTAMYIRGLLEGIIQGPDADEEIRRRLKTQASQLGSSVLHARMAQVDPVSAQRVHPNDLKRIIRSLEFYELTGKPISSLQSQFKSGQYRYPWKLVGLRREKENANGRINQRVKRMIDEGLVDEVMELLNEPRGLSRQAAQAVGYAEIIAYLNGEMKLDDAIEQIKINTRRLAKRQRTWFRSFADVMWVDLEADTKIEDVADRYIDEYE